MGQIIANPKKGKKSKFNIMQKLRQKGSFYNITQLISKQYVFWGKEPILRG